VAVSERAPEATAGGFEPAVPRTSAHPPARAEGVVPRPDLVEELCSAPDGALVLLVAPAGYGKSTLALEWAEADARDVAWASTIPADDDPVHLVQHLALAVHQVRPLPEATARILLAAGRSAEVDLVPALARALEELDGRLLLVVDDVHLLTDPASLACLDGLLALAPASLTVALVGRAQPLPVGRRRLERTVVELGQADLAMGAEDGRLLLELAGTALDVGAVDDLVARTEGWPAGLRLAAVVEQRSDASGLSGRHRLVADYLVEEVLSGLDEDRVRFLEESSVLAEMTPGLVDELLGRDDAGTILREVERTTGVFLVPLDAERGRYRYHHLFGEMLQDRLRTRDPVRATWLHAEASRLAEASGDTDAAIRHAVDAGDRARAARLVVDEAAPLVSTGRVERFGRWLSMVGEDAIDADPTAAAAWAWYGINAGQPALAVRGLAALRRADPDLELGGGLTARTGVAMCDAMIGADGVPQVVADCEVVRAGREADGAWTTIASLVQVGAELMLGHFDEARRLAQRLLPSIEGSPALAAYAWAQLALLDLEAGDLEPAEQDVRRAIRLTEEHDLEGVTSIAVAFATGALLEARRGRRAESDALATAAQRMCARLGPLSPRTQLYAYVLLARSALALGDPAAARAMAAEADRCQQREATAVTLNGWLRDVHAQLEAAQGADLLPDQRLTPAELRLLPHLATHRSLQEIAERLHVSRNTAKTQSVAIYRKLQVQSRSAAVEAARERGYLSA
jgi:LuxR family maltose regulon positive regulatory protein